MEQVKTGAIITAAAGLTVAGAILLKGIITVLSKDNSRKDKEKNIALNN
jgi:hypothetical protein